MQPVSFGYNSNYNRDIKINKHGFTPPCRIDFSIQEDIAEFAPRVKPLQEGQSKLFNIHGRNYTCFAREDLPWRDFGKYLQTRYAPYKKVNIYQYASSSAEETYSIKMMLNNVFHEKAKKFYPIIAKDIDEDIVTSNKLHQQIGTMLQFDDCMRIVGTLGLNPDEASQYFSTKSVNPKSNALCLFVLNPEMAKDIEFECANILKDVDSIDSNHPSIVFCRNVWPYIKEEEYEKYAQKLYEKLAPGSIVVIGDYDYANRHPMFPDVLENAGFIPNESLMNVTGHCVVFEKN